VLIGVFRRA